MVFMFWLAALLLFWTYVGYPLFLFLANKLVSPAVYSYPARGKYKVAFIIVAHNEESVIREKIENTLSLDFDDAQVEIIVASDFSDDGTDEIVLEYRESGVRLVRSQERKGKTNAQNEACRGLSADFYVFSDANTIWNLDAFKKLLSGFSDPLVGYVTGQLKYSNINETAASSSEGVYWKYEMFLRGQESKFHSVTAGNGAIYAIRSSLFEEVDPMFCHDSEFPFLVVSKGSKAIYVETAVAYEKAGESAEDEYSRKTRMFGRSWYKIINNFWMFNPSKTNYKFVIEYISHRLLRYSSGILHLILLLLNCMLIVDHAFPYTYFLGCQVICYTLALIGCITKSPNKIFYIPFYYCVFQLATIIGFKKAVTGQVVPFWKKAESTRS